MPRNNNNRQITKNIFLLLSQYAINNVTKIKEHIRIYVRFVISKREAIATPKRKQKQKTMNLLLFDFNMSSNIPPPFNCYVTIETSLPFMYITFFGFFPSNHFYIIIR